uniref:High affinity immunoglobulin epsilon receptor subunit gamma n=1 Tax=Equus asinus TaxID=9793 RepID=A0A9L0K3Z5_EQUAS
MGIQRGRYSFLLWKAPLQALCYLPEPFPFSPLSTRSSLMPLTPRALSIPSAALGEPQLCYILDAILFLYGIVLTLLYCRLKVRLGWARVEAGRRNGRVVAAWLQEEGTEEISPVLRGERWATNFTLLITSPLLQIQVRKAAIASYEKSDAVYTGLSTRTQETYETLKHEKPPQ